MPLSSLLFLSLDESGRSSISMVHIVAIVIGFGHSVVGIRIKGEQSSSGSVDESLMIMVGSFGVFSSVVSFISVDGVLSRGTWSAETD